MAAVIARNAALHTNRPAVNFEGATITHGEFARRAWSLAAATAGFGLLHGDRFAILSQNRPEFLEVYAAAQSGGFAAVTVNWRLAAPEVARVLDDAETSVLFLEERFLTLFEAARQHMQRVPPRTVLFGTDYESLIAESPADRPAANPGPDDIAQIIYTSGTTGAPKGVMLSQRGLAEGAFTIALVAGHRPTDRMLVSMPLFHSGATIEWTSMQVMGGACVLMRQWDSAEALELIARQHVTVAHLAPVMIKGLMEFPDRPRYDLRSLRQVNYGSGPMAPEQLRRATAVFGPIFTQIYGMTENITISALLPSQASPDGPPAEQERLSSAGQPHPGTEVRICGDEGEDLPTGEVGEIVVRSRGLMSGYWRNPTQTAQALAGGWMHTGDMGRLDADGFLYVVDRKKDMIVSGGENVYSREVEDALHAHPAVAEASVIGVPDARWGEAVFAYVVLRPGMAADESELIAHTRTLIAGYKRPQRIAFIDALPRLPHGKIDKKALRAPHWAGQERNVA